MKNTIIVGCGGFIGAVLRYWIGFYATRFFGASMYGTLIVNILGCFCLGYLSGLVAAGKLLSTDIQILLQTGLFGALTTFSTFIFDISKLWEEKDIAVMFVILVAHLFLGFTFFWLGRTIN